MMIGKVYLADVLSYVRAGLAPFVAVFILTGHWKIAFVGLVVAWGTDPFDGIVARKYGSAGMSTDKDQDVDGKADSAIAFATSLAVATYAGFNWRPSVVIFLGAVFVLSRVSATLMVSDMSSSTRKSRLMIRFNMVVFHGLYQIVGMIVLLAYLAFGLVAAIGAFCVLLILTIQQRHKVARWFKGQL